MNPPSQPAMLSFSETTTVAGDGGYSNIGTIEGWIQIESKNKDPQRLLTLTGRKLTGEKDEYWIEFLPASGKLRLFDGSEPEAPFADGQPHHFAFMNDRNDGMSLGFDGNDPKKLTPEKTTDDTSEDPTKANLLVQQLTIGHFKDRSGFVGKIAGLHLWKKTLTPDEISCAGNWQGSYCPTVDFGFKGIDSSELRGYLNREGPSFIFYYEPQGHWVMDGTESDVPKQADLPDCDQYHHAIYDAPRYFLTTREKKSNKLYIISDNAEKNPLCLSPDQSKQFVFTADDIILKFNFELNFEKEDRLEIVSESFSVESKPGKPLPDEFRPVPDHEAKCYRPSVLEEDTGNEQKFGDIFAHNPNNFDKSRLGWNEIWMKDPFDSSTTGAENMIFGLPPGGSKRYVKTNNMAIPYGFKFLPTPFSEGTMHSTLVANGSDLRKAATKTTSIKGNVKGGCAFVSATVSFHYNSELSKTEGEMYDKEVMHSQHTYFVSVHTIVLDKANVRLSEEHGPGRLTGFLPEIREYAKGHKSGAEIFSTYGTHYAHAICYGARGRARQTYTKEAMSNLLQECKKIGWGVEAKVSAKIAGFKGGIGGGYSQEDATEDSSKISKTQNSEDSDYSCIGGSACNSSGHVEGVDQHAVPVLLDLKPITELLAPPFFDTYEMTVTVRRKLMGDLMSYLRGNKPRGVDVFHYLSLSFLQPTCPELWQGGHRIDSGAPKRFQTYLPATVKVTGCSSGDKSALLQLPPFTTWTYDPRHGGPGTVITQTFCYSGNKTDHTISMEFTLPKGTPEQHTGWSWGAMEPLRPLDEPQVMKLTFALDDERLYSKDGVTGTFVLPQTTTRFNRADNFAITNMTFPVVLKKLNLQDAFFNGLSAEWKENLKSLAHS